MKNATFDPGAVKKRIIELCKIMNARGWLAAADGNVSFRISDRRILITPTGKNKAFITPKDFAVITIDNEIISGTPSGERLMHLEVYKHSPLARAVVHAHPPSPVAWSIARPELAELPADGMSEAILSVGSVPIVPYSRPGTLEMGTKLHPYLPRSRALILARHGVICWGESLEEAYNGVERLEAIAGILAKASALGGISPLPEAEVDYLRALRAKLGERIL